MVKTLVESLLACPEVTQIIVTRNIPELLNIVSSERVLLIDNAMPKGFGANHNAAFSNCVAPYFCPLNPDISLQGNPFSELITAMDKSDSSIAAPLILSPDGCVEDSIRRFPTIGSLASKVFGRADGRYVVQSKDPIFYPEWIAGMFLIFRSADFARLSGFDEGFFLYYEDVDICARAWEKGMKVLAFPSVSVIHDARRDSHRSTKHLRWHLSSMGRYFWKHWWRLPKPNAGR